MSSAFRHRVTIAECFDEMLARAPDSEVLVTRSGRWSVQEFNELSNRAATVLMGLGIKAGDRIGVSLPNDVEILAAFHGAMRLGAIWVGVNQNLAVPEKAYLLTDSGASLWLADTQGASDIDAQRKSFPDLRTTVALEEFSSRLGSSPPVDDLFPIDPDAPAGLGYTSGTTGRPKGAVHSQRNLLTPGVSLVASRGWGTALRKGDCFALTILNMMALTLLTTSAAGGTAVIMDTLSARGVAEWLSKEQVTVWNGPPALLHTMLNDPEIQPEALSSLSEVWSGGAALPEDLRTRFGKYFGVNVIGTYGLTEAPTVVSIDPADGEHRDGFSGKVLPHLDVEVTRVAGVAAPAGELCLKPLRDGDWNGIFTPVLGYWNKPEASATLLADGLVHTGDIGLIDQGWLKVLDRQNLLIIRGGANIYPAEVERVVGSFEEVRACCVLGLEDPRLGERVAVVIEVEDGTVIDLAEIRARCAVELASYKIPERLAVVETLPRNAMGKIERGDLHTLFE